MFTQSLKEAIERHRKEDTLKPFSEQEPLSELDKKLIQEDKENYEAWLKDPTTQKIFQFFEKQMEDNNIKLLNHCLGTGIERPVEDRKVLYYSLKNRVIGEMLRVLKRSS